MAGNVTGGTRIVVDGDNMGIYLQANGLAPQMMHQQFIHAAGGKCPDMTADKNGDSVIDEKEASAVMGPASFPLTLGTQASTGSAPTAGTIGSEFPVAGQNGDLIYINSFPVSMVMSALSSSGTTGPQVPTSGTPETSGTPRNYVSSNPNPSAPSTNSNRFNMENSVVEIRGIASNAQMPGTVQGNDPGSQANASIPVACGVLVKISE